MSSGVIRDMNLRVEPLVVGTDRPDEHLFSIQKPLTRLPLHGIGPDRGRGGRDLLRVFDLDPGVEREQPFFIGEQRVDIERRGWPGAARQAS